MVTDGPDSVMEGYQSGCGAMRFMTHLTLVTWGLCGWLDYTKGDEHKKPRQHLLLQWAGVMALTSPAVGLGTGRRCRVVSCLSQERW